MTKIDWIKKSSTDQLLKSIGNMIPLGLVVGFMCGMGVTLAGIAIKSEDTNGYLVGGLLVVILLLFLALEQMIRKRLIPELKSRCNPQ